MNGMIFVIIAGAYVAYRLACLVHDRSSNTQHEGE